MVAKNEKQSTNTNETEKAGFVLNEDQLALLVPKGGKKAKPSEYLETVRGAIKSGDAIGLPVTATIKATWIMGQLRKAEKELEKELDGGTLQKWNREEHGFVGFKYVPKAAEVEASA